MSIGKNNSKKLICPDCKGNGHIRVTFEAEKSILQCKTCKSEGEVEDWTHYHQTWKEPNGNKCFYFGPKLRPEDFKNYKIYKE